MAVWHKIQRLGLLKLLNSQVMQYKRETSYYLRLITSGAAHLETPIGSTFDSYDLLLNMYLAYQLLS